MNNIINIDYHSREAIYEQIINQIERYVALGILKSGEQIPSTRELASILGINPNTVKKAYSILESKGVIVTISTKGTYIAYNTKKIVDEIKKNCKILMDEGYKKVVGILHNGYKTSGFFNNEPIDIPNEIQNSPDRTNRLLPERQQY